MAARLLRVALFLALLLPVMPVKTADARPDKPAKADFAVVHVIGSDGTVSFEVVETKELKAFAKRQADAYKDAAKEWKKAKKENKGKATSPAPKKPKMKVLKKGLKSEDDAKALAEKYKKAWDEKQKKKKKS